MKFYVYYLLFQLFKDKKNVIIKNQRCIKQQDSFKFICVMFELNSYVCEIVIIICVNF